MSRNEPPTSSRDDTLSIWSYRRGHRTCFNRQCSGLMRTCPEVRDLSDEVYLADLDYDYRTRSGSHLSAVTEDDS